MSVDGHRGSFPGNRNWARFPFPGFRAWEGKQGAKQGDCIGMLLDLDQGSMTVWKTDVKLGAMQAEGLRGPFCWAVSMYRQGSTVRMDQ